MASSLAERLRGIVKPSNTETPNGCLEARELGTLHDIARTASILGGGVVERSDGAVIVVDRHYAVDRSHGRERIGGMIETLVNGGDAIDTLLRAWPSRSQQPSPAVRAAAPCLLFLDLETTGIAGGAGTQAFLVGCAVIEGEELLVRQFLLPALNYERALLESVRAWLAPDATLVTFNGRSFDLPLIETRYLFHRLEFPLADSAHVDMLHPSRRLWKERPSIAGPSLDDDCCKLAVLERHLAGVHRIGDVPGYEIPSRFFRYVRSGDAAPLAAVLEHNRMDLVSLAVVMARAIRLIQRGAPATQHPRECLGLGRLYERAGMRDHAESCYANASLLAGRIGREPDVRAEALRRLALCRRRAGRMREAAEAWMELVTLPACPVGLRREAREALAIHHEHRSRDLETARTLVIDALSEAPPARWRAHAEHRLHRIDRKLQSHGQRDRPRLDFAS